jgi:RNA polymerase sigma-70 factor (sigma-E family)
LGENAEEATVASDDRDTFTAWASARQQALFRTAYLLTADRSRADDLTQSALIKVAARWARLRPGDPDAYARTCIVRDNISIWRRRRRELLVAAVPELAIADPSASTDRRLAVASALATLTARQRTVLVLRYYIDLTEQQTADELGISIGTVKAHAHQALIRLRSAAPELAEFVDRSNRPEAST